SHGVPVRAREVERDVATVADDPAVVSGTDEEEIARRELDDPPVREGDAGASFEHVSDVLHLAEPRPGRGADVLGPAPARLVRRAPDGHGAERDELERSLLEAPDL